MDLIERAYKPELGSGFILCRGDGLSLLVKLFLFRFLFLRTIAQFLAGFVFLATATLLYMNTVNTEIEAVNPWLFKPLSLVMAVAGLLLIASRDE